MISIIVAASDNDVIGHLSKLPWYLPRDLKNFSSLTTGHTAVMGRKTFESILARLGHPLPNRKNVVITHNEKYKAPECIVATSWEKAMEKIKGDEIFVSGGVEIYKMALPYANRLYLTRVHTICEGDVLLPIKDFSDWNLIHKEFWAKDEKNKSDATYYIYERKFT